MSAYCIPPKAAESLMGCFCLLTRQVIDDYNSNNNKMIDIVSTLKKKDSYIDYINISIKGIKNVMECSIEVIADNNVNYKNYYKTDFQMAGLE